MQDTDEKFIIVTGGAGYIGSHVCKGLALAGYTPVSYDNLEHGHAWAVQWGPLETGNILDAAALDQLFHKYRPRAVMHFAAYAYVGESVNNPGKYYRNNVVGTHTLLERMLHHGIADFIFSSSCAVYGIPDQIPIPEGHTRNPINPYGRTKYIVELMLDDYFRTNDLRYVSLRYFNAAGADPDSEIGETHEPETHLIPLVLRNAAGLSPHIEIYGEDYETPDGTCIRDYIHVTDLADAHIRALEYLLQGGKSRSFNLGTETGFSVREIVDHSAKVTGKKISVKTGVRRPGDPPCLVADASSIRSELGWTARYSRIEDILTTAWEWQVKAVNRRLP